MVNKISSGSRIALCVAAILLLVSLYVPIWQIGLDAPQYPEGLALQIWANRIGGDVDIVNGLNHYIGMKTLHTEDFKEFAVLPYIIAAYALLFIIAAVGGSRGWLNFVLIAFIIFGIVAMVDFWKWEYDYGHNLDPNAAIKVPGMSYQPPLIGFKQLLNFGAYSVPAVGGWMFVVAGVIVLLAAAKENGWLKRVSPKPASKVQASMLVFALLLSSCDDGQPHPVQLNVDGCDYCRMTISDHKWAAELVTTNGRIYKFDDLNCMLRFTVEGSGQDIKRHYISNYLGNNELIDAHAAWYVSSESYNSPMGGNTAAFISKEAATEAGAKINSGVQNWDELKKQHPSKNSNSHHEP